MKDKGIKKTEKKLLGREILLRRNFSRSSMGFTVVELLVVVGIIAILIMILLPRITPYIRYYMNKSKDSAARSDLSTLLTTALIYYDHNGNYNIFNGPYSVAYQNVVSALSQQGYKITSGCDSGATCPDTATRFCASVPLKANSNTYCIDTSGTKKEATLATCQITTGVCQ